LQWRYTQIVEVVGFVWGKYFMFKLNKQVKFTREPDAPHGRRLFRIVFLLAVMASLMQSFASTKVLAKYMSTATGSAVARIAKWDVKIVQVTGDTPVLAVTNPTFFFNPGTAQSATVKFTVQNDSDVAATVTPRIVVTEGASGAFTLAVSPASANVVPGASTAPFTGTLTVNTTADNYTKYKIVVDAVQID
jgi:hypothetical protein